MLWPRDLDEIAHNGRTASGCRIAGAGKGDAMRTARFVCQQCGHCCLNLSDAIATCATEADVRRWEAAGRDDILVWVDPIAVGDAHVYDIWINPKTGEDVRRCPWLRKVRGADRYVCRIRGG